MFTLRLRARSQLTGLSWRRSRGYSSPSQPLQNSLSRLVL